MPGNDPTSHAPYSLWCPPELTAAAGPLRRVGDVLVELADDKREIEQLSARIPSGEVSAALRDFCEAWDLVLWNVGGTARSLGHELRRAAEDYIGSDDDLARQARAAAEKIHWRDIR